MTLRQLLPPPGDTEEGDDQEGSAGQAWQAHRQDAQGLGCQLRGLQRQEGAGRRCRLSRRGDGRPRAAEEGGRRSARVVVVVVVGGGGVCGQRDGRMLTIIFISIVEH